MKLGFRFCNPNDPHSVQSIGYQVRSHRKIGLRHSDSHIHPAQKSESNDLKPPKIASLHPLGQFCKGIANSELSGAVPDRGGESQEERARGCNRVRLNAFSIGERPRRCQGPILNTV
jgi:hypothetical protein